jgi:hypothetical protein
VVHTPTTILERVIGAHPARLAVIRAIARDTDPRLAANWGQDDAQRTRKILNATGPEPMVPIDDLSTSITTPRRQFGP